MDHSHGPNGIYSKNKITRLLYDLCVYSAYELNNVTLLFPAQFCDGCLISVIF